MTTLNGYQHWTHTTAVYPDAGAETVTALTYVALGLAGEAGELANNCKKLLRDGDTEEMRDKMRAELGDVAWYVARLADELGLPLSIVVDKNMAKLEDRALRGVLTGSGDQR